MSSLAMAGPAGELSAAVAPRGGVIVAPEPPVPVSVMSYNIQGYGALFSRRYLEGIARVIRRARPEVVGLQEVHRGTWASRFGDQVEILAELTGMEPSFGRSLILRTGEYGNALLTRGRLIEEEVEILPGEAERRSMLRCRIGLDGDSGEEESFDVFVTHLAAWGRLARSIRVRQAHFLAERFHAIDRPFVLVGDLNAPPEAPELAPLVDHGRLRLCGDRGCSTHRFMRKRIDYVFAGPSWQRVRAEVLRAGPSDHYPVLAKLWPEGPDAPDERAAGEPVRHVAEPLPAEAAG